MQKCQKFFFRKNPKKNFPVSGEKCKTICNCLQLAFRATGKHATIYNINLYCGNLVLCVFKMRGGNFFNLFGILY